MLKDYLKDFKNFICNDIVKKNLYAFSVFVITTLLLTFYFFDNKMLVTFYGIIMLIFNITLLLKLIIKVIFPFIHLDQLYKETVEENSIASAILLSAYIVSISLLIIYFIKFILFN